MTATVVPTPAPLPPPTYTPEPPVEKVVETVLVEKIIETVVVEKPVTRTERILETVIVEKQVDGRIVKVVETVIVERPVTRLERVVETVVVLRPVPSEEAIKITPTPTQHVPTATPIPVPTTPPEPARGDNLVIGVPAICPPIFNNRFLSGACFEHVQMWGFTEGLTWMKHAPPPAQVDEEDQTKSMIESWEWDRHANTLTWVIKTGIPFHDPWTFGEVDAEDVAFSFNQAMAEDSTFTRADQLRSWIGAIEAIDERTVLINCTDAGCQEDWIVQQSNYNGQTASITSFEAFIELGVVEAWANLDNMTGPFRATRWETNEVIESEAVRDHWRWEPLIDTLKFVEIPEDSVRMAAFIAGEIHLADLPPRLAAQAVIESGGRAQQIGGGRGQGVFYAGNYWATTDYLGLGGEDIDESIDVSMRPGYLPDDDHPWIGEWGNDASMERARKVRTAMSMLLDWEWLSENVFGGLAGRGWSWYGWTPEHAEWDPSWQIDYEPDSAQQLLEEAGYGDGFSFTYWVPSDLPIVIDPELGEAIAKMWVDGGLDPKIEKTSYVEHRHNLVARSMDMPWAWATHGNTYRKDTNVVSASVPRAGRWNPGFEFPDEMGLLWYDSEEQHDPVARRAINAEVTDFVNHWRLYSPVVNVVPYWAVRPEVTSWDPYSGNLPYFNSPHTIGFK